MLAKLRLVAEENKKQKH